MSRTQNNVGTERKAEPKTGRNVRRAEPIEPHDAAEQRQKQVEEAERIAREHPSGTTDRDLPERDGRGMLTRSAMEKVLAAGGSVLVHRRNAMGDIVDGQAVTRIEHLPSEADLSEGDADAEQAALRAIEDRQRLLESDKQKILSRRGQNAQNAQNEDRRREQDGRAAEQKQQQQNAAALHPQGGSGTASVPNTPPPATGPRPGQQPGSQGLPPVPHVPTEGE